MTLDKVMEGIMPVLPRWREIAVSGISYDSRSVKPGHVFVASAGEKTDGHAFIGDAAARGACAVVYEREEAVSGLAGPLPEFICVENSRAALAGVANNFFGRPSEQIRVIGITGTNGKTTVSYIVKSVLEAWGKKTGLIGTIRHMVGDEVIPALHTTPEAPDYQGLLHSMRAAGCTFAVSEVSSHALAQRRVDGTSYGTAVFTNLTRDHLDFHGTMDDYFAAKARLFAELLRPGGAAVINGDDGWGRKIPVRSGCATLTYGLGSGAELVADEIENSFDGLKFRVSMGGEGHEIVSPLMGLPNVYNILAAAGVARSLDIPWGVISEGVRNAGTVTGRFEKVDASQPFLAVVDYAHTEDALERLIYTARGLTRGRIITVFGCGGDRDRGKRPVMGEIATRLSDFVLVTSDNPRSEKPEDIIREITAGAVRKNYLVEPDRGEAIRRAVTMAAAGDVVLIAGKGHETYQEARGSRSAFSDREVLERAIRQLTGKTKAYENHEGCK